VRSIDGLVPALPSSSPITAFPIRSLKRDKWLARYAAFSVASGGVPLAQAAKGISSMKERLPVLSPEQDVAILRDAGFRDIELFYAGFTFKGWVGYRD
jgi:tRNA (cmo5U34)-methyltransferase